MKAKQQKSGRWQARYIDHYIYVDGKKKPVLGCVTADTEREAIKEAYRREGKGKQEREITVKDAIAGYIAVKAAVLSPATLRSYRSLEENAYEQIAGRRLSELAGAPLQAWVSKYSETHSPKSVRNAYGLLCGSVRMYDPTVNMTATLPQKIKPDLYTPTDADIKKLLEHIAGTDLEKAVILAAFGTMRRGEVCALTYDDISGEIVTINKSMVELKGGGTGIKVPKTEDGTRKIVLPEKAIQILLRGKKEGGRVVDMTPSALSNAFPKALKACGLPPFRYHDLRAYAASVMHAIGIPDQYIKQMGGWRSDVYRRVYRRTMSDKEQEFRSRSSAHFGELIK